MKKVLFTFFAITISLSSIAQKKLLLVDTLDKVKYEIKSDDYIFFAYNGYMMQKEKFLGYVYTISGDTLVMYGNDDSDENLISSIFGSKDSYTKFLIKDITGIKKLWKYREVVQVSSYIALFAIDLLLINVLTRNNVSQEEATLIAFGAGTGVSVLFNVITQPKIQIKINNNWRFKTVE